MKALAVILLLCTSAFAQSPEALKYASRQVLLVDPHPGVEAILPVVFTADGKQYLEFVPLHEIKDSLNKGGRPIALADILAALNGATEKINQLQAENEKLWNVVTKQTPKSETIVIQQATSQPSESQIAAQQQADASARRQQAIQTWLLLQGANQPRTINLNYRNCNQFPALCVGR